MKDKLIEIFRAGKFTTADGQDVEYTPDDITEIFNNYDPKWHRAAFTTDHKKNGPAHGYVKQLIRKGNSLYCKFSDMTKELRDATKDRFGRISVEIWPNIKGKGKCLRAVSLLGVKPAAVKGLEIFETPVEQDPVVVEFEVSESGDDQAVTINATAAEAADPAGTETGSQDFAEQLAERERKIAELEQEKQALADRFQAADADKQKAENRLQEINLTQRKLDFERYLNQQVAWGEIPPALKKKVLRLMQALDGVHVFSEEGTEVPAVDEFKEMLKSIGEIVSFDEQVTKKKAPATELGSKEIAAKALEFQQSEKAAGRFVTIPDAVKHVTKNTN